MKKPDKIQEPYINLLCRALQLFYKNDANALFDKPQEGTKADAGGKDGKIKIVNERAMVGCVYRYMWCMMQQKISDIFESDIDIEYDRMVEGDSEDFKYNGKEIVCKCNWRECWNSEKCVGVITRKILECRRKKDADADLGTQNDDNLRRLVRPDIIVHNRNKRGQSNDGLVVEFKKEHDKLDNADVEFDMAKLYYFTCMDDDAQFHYKVGAMVVLRPKYADVDIIWDKNILRGYRVSASGKEMVGDTEIKFSLLCNS